MGLSNYFSKEIETLLYGDWKTKTHKMWVYLTEKILQIQIKD